MLLLEWPQSAIFLCHCKVPLPGDDVAADEDGITLPIPADGAAPLALPEPPDFPLTPFPPADLEPALLPTAHELVSVDAPPNHKKFLGVWGIPMKVIDVEDFLDIFRCLLHIASF